MARMLCFGLACLLLLGLTGLAWDQFGRSGAGAPSAAPSRNQDAGAQTRATDALGHYPAAIPSYVDRPSQATAAGCEYWVAPPPAGNDNYPGTSDLPWATLQQAAKKVPDNQCTVWFADGVYPGFSRLNRRFTTPTTFTAIHPYGPVFENRGTTVAISGGTNVMLEGFEFRQTGPRAGELLFVVDRSEQGWAELITLRNNIFHDSYNDDLLKIHNGARFVTVEGNVFYNQGDSAEHMDVNSVTDVVIQDNIFFNDYAGSGRTWHDTKHYIVIKDSNEGEDGLLGSQRIIVRRNVFLNWQGRETDTFIQVGLDGKPYYEARDVQIENNLLIGNAPNDMLAAFGVRGARDVVFANNTVTGDLPSSAYGMWVSVTDSNPKNQNIYFCNNIWSDPTGTMGIRTAGGEARFSQGHLTDTNNLVLDNNLYWNAGEAIPRGELVSPLLEDAHRVVADPQLNRRQMPMVLPRWNGSTFLSGSRSARQEFLRLVGLYGAIPSDSPASGKADPAFTPAEDILGCPRGVTADLGAYDATCWQAIWLPTVTGARATAR